MDKLFRDRVRGCLIAGAAGDALGYEVEFTSLGSICSRFGQAGIREYVTDRETGKAIISDDTQMTLFTANGLLLQEGHPGERTPESWIYTAYLDWLETQESVACPPKLCWLREIPELRKLRAPGGTCLNALRYGDMGSVDEPINNSKGCGGIMRVAPVAVYGRTKGWDAAKTAALGAEAAAITHGHPFGWMSAAALTDIVYRILGGDDVSTAVYECMDDMERIYEDNPWSAKLTRGMRLAVGLAKNNASDAENIRQLGEGWVGEEALYIAVYCAVKYADDLDGALAAAVNHNGDSDSTGAITGNILGACLGYEAVSEKWKANLELHDVILEIADDFCMAEKDRDAEWNRKYAG